MNIIPVIAKADTISKSELHKFKIKIMSELVSNGVQIYQFPLDDETVAKVNTTMNVRKHTHTQTFLRYRFRWMFLLAEMFETYNSNFRHTPCVFCFVKGNISEVQKESVILSENISVGVWSTTALVKVFFQAVSFASDAWIRLVYDFFFL